MGCEGLVLHLSYRHYKNFYDPDLHPILVDLGPISKKWDKKGKQIGTSEAISDLKGMSVAYDIILIMERAI